MSTRACKVCGNGFRKGTLAYVMGERGLKGTIVCATCAKEGVLVVAAKPVPTCKKCNRRATLCHEHASGGTNTDIKDAIKVLEGRLKASQMTPRKASKDERDDAVYAGFHSGKIEGLESAIELLKSGRF